MPQHAAPRIFAGHWFAVSAAWLMLAIAGCGPEKPASPTSSAAPAANAEIKLLVVDDPEIAEAIEQLRGDWKARTRTTLEIRQAKSVELIAAEKPAEPFDVVIYPSALLGTLAERGWIGPLPPDYATSGELAWGDTLELVQIADTVWGPQPHAVSFGDALLVCYYRPDLFERFKKHPPESWADYHELAAFFQRRENLGDAAPAADAPWSGTIEPLARSWGGRVLLARAAPYARHLDNYSTLFQVSTMEPLIDGPPFVKALEELVADAKLGPSDANQLDPAAARQAFLAGRAAMTLTFPGHAGSQPAESAKERMPLDMIALPGSAKVYNIGAALGPAKRGHESARYTVGRRGTPGFDCRKQWASRPGVSFARLAFRSRLGHARGRGQRGNDDLSPFAVSRPAPLGRSAHRFSHRSPLCHARARCSQRARLPRRAPAARAGPLSGCP